MEGRLEGRRPESFEERRPNATPALAPLSMPITMACVGDLMENLFCPVSALKAKALRTSWLKASTEPMPVSITPRIICLSPGR